MAELRKNAAGEIAAALFRVAGGMRQGRLRDEFENYAVELVLRESKEAVEILGKLLKLAELSGYVGREMAAILMRELGQFVYTNAASTRDNKEEREMAAIEILRRRDRGEEKEEEEKGEGEGGGEGKEKEKEKEKEREKGDTPVTGKKLIDETLRYIQENPVSRLRDIQLRFEKASERTVRRVLEHLVQMGRIERVGSPGPASFYRPRKEEKPQKSGENEVILLGGDSAESIV